MPPRLREIVSGCLAKDPAARPAPRALAAAVAGRDQGTGPSAVTFWPRSVGSLIGAYQARLEQETAGRPGDGTVAHPPTTLSGSGPGPGPGPGLAAGQGAAAPGYAQPQGYGQGYPAPQGYAGARGPQAPPRGYTPGGPAGPGAPGAPGGPGGLGGPAGYPQGYRPAPPVPLTPPPPPPPASLLNAVRLMYAGAAFTALEALGVIAVAGPLIKKHATQVTASGHTTTLGGVVAVTIFFALIEIALWLGIARACRNGRNWARITGTVLFGLHTLGFLGVLSNAHPGIGLAKLLAVIGWLIACGATVFLWQRPSSAFFTRTALPR